MSDLIALAPDNSSDKFAILPTNSIKYCSLPKSAGGMDEQASLGRRDRINSKICDLPLDAEGPYKTKHIGVDNFVAIPVILTPNIC